MSQSTKPSRSTGQAADSMEIATSKSFFQAGMVELSLGLIALVVGELIGFNLRESIPAWNDWNGLRQSVLLGMAVSILLFLLIQGIGALPIRSLQQLERLTKDQLNQAVGPMTIPQLLVLSLTAGIGEEFLFRGLIQGWFLSYYSSPSFVQAIPGILVSSLLFGIAHPLTRSYIVIASCMGVLFALVYWWTRDLLACILAHAFYDAMILTYWRWTEFRAKAS